MDKCQNQLKRIEGQIRGIEKMIGEGKNCEAVLMQLSAAISSLKSVSKKILLANMNDKNYAKLLEKFL